MNVLVIGDLHAPAIHQDYLSFLLSVKKKYKCDKVVSVGDIIDCHSISYHDHNPDGLSSGDEIEKTIESLTPFYKAFPTLDIMKGNHDELITRKLVTHGISIKYVKTMNEIFKMPKKWQWYDSLEIDNVLYLHGTGKSGKYAHINWATSNRQSTVIGHIHSHAGINFLASKKDLIFGMNVGCGIDIKAYNFDYGKNFADRPILGCGVVMNGSFGMFIPMNLN